MAIASVVENFLVSLAESLVSVLFFTSAARSLTLLCHSSMVPLASLSLSTDLLLALVIHQHRAIFLGVLMHCGCEALQDGLPNVVGAELEAQVVRKGDVRGVPGRSHSDRQRRGTCRRRTRLLAAAFSSGGACHLHIWSPQAPAWGRERWWCIHLTIQKLSQRRLCSQQRAMFTMDKEDLAASFEEEKRK